MLTEITDVIGLPHVPTNRQHVPSSLMHGPPTAMLQLNLATPARQFRTAAGAAEPRGIDAFELQCRKPVVRGFPTAARARRRGADAVLAAERSGIRPGENDRKGLATAAGAPAAVSRWRVARWRGSGETGAIAKSALTG